MAVNSSGSSAAQHRMMRTAALLVAPTKTAEACAKRVAAALAAALWRVDDGSLPHATILVAPDLRPRAVREWIAVTERNAQPGTTLLVTGGARSNLRQLARIVVAAVVLEEEIDREFIQRLEALARLPLRTQLNEAAVWSTSLDHLVREAVIAACKADPPIRSVKTLIRQLGCQDRKTLWSAWQSAPDVLGTTTDFLHKVLLLHYLDRREQKSVENYAREELGASPRTVYRTAALHFGATPRELRASPDPIRKWVSAAVVEINEPRHGNASHPPSPAR